MAALGRIDCELSALDRLEDRVLGSCGIPFATARRREILAEICGSDARLRKLQRQIRTDMLGAIDLTGVSDHGE